MESSLSRQRFSTPPKHRPDFCLRKFKMKYFLISLFKRIFLFSFQSSFISLFATPLISNCYADEKRIISPKQKLMAKNRRLSDILTSKQKQSNSATASSLPTPHIITKINRSINTPRNRLLPPSEK